jgi:dephospho-CoA kinase
MTSQNYGLVNCRVIRMFKIGLTGGIGSGKSAATKVFESLGITVVDADIVAREVVELGSPALAQIATYFGASILTDSGELNRRALREIIFATPEAKDWLEALLHPLIRESITQQLDKSSSPYSILSSPLLFETNQHKLVNRCLLIDAPVELQVARASSRDYTDEAQIRSIIAQQMSRQCKTEKADDIILNDKDIKTLEHNVQRQHDIYMEMIHDKPCSRS